MLRRKSTLVGLYFLTLICVCGMTMVGPAVGGAITNLTIETPGSSIGSGTKNIDFGSLTGTNNSVNLATGNNWDFAVGLWTNDTDLVKLLVNASSFSAGNLYIGFEFDYVGETLSNIALSITGQSTNVTGILGLFPDSPFTGTTCDDYGICLPFGTGAINVSAPLNGVDPLGSLHVNGELYLVASDVGSLVIGADSADIGLQSVPEPSSVVLLASGLGILAWLRRRIREV